MLIDLPHLQLLQKVFTQKHLDTGDIISAFDIAPEILTLLPKNINYDTKTALYFLENYKASACLLAERTKDKFIKAICESLSQPDYKPTTTLSKKYIWDFIQYGEKLPVGSFKKPVFIITDTVGKELMKETENKVILWLGFLQYQIPKSIIKKYWKENIRSLEFLPSKDFTQDMINALINHKTYLNFQGGLDRFLLQLYLDRPDIFTNEMLVRATTNHRINYSIIDGVKLFFTDKVNVFPLVLTLCEYLQYGRSYASADRLDKETQVYIDLTQDKEMICDYLANKIAQTKRVPAEQVK